MHRLLGSTFISVLLVGGLGSAGCSDKTAAPVEATGSAQEADAIASYEQPETLVAGASRRLADNISADDIGKDFGLPDERAPYPDTYWPYIQGGSDARWNPYGIDPRTPLEKYMAATNPFATDLAKVWEYQNHGTGMPNVQTWHGHCPGWAAASTSNAPIRHPVFAAPNGQGGITPCQEGEYGCVRFEIGDLNALMAEAWLDGPAAVLGTGCNTPPYYIPRDLYGRIAKPGCDGVNAGSLLVVASTLLKQNQTAFAIEAQNPQTTAQIRNQPTYRYHVYDFHPLTRSQAANMVARGTTSGPDASYPWNPAARGFAFVDLGLRFVGEDHAHLDFVSGTHTTYEMRMAAVIELDADASNPNAKILGGEYLDLPSSQANRLTVPPYVWVSRGAGPDQLPWYVNGSQHNPYVRPSVVKQLVALGQQ
ncbi:MAG: hypothetical protein QM820_65015 [Minicystis sp.]